MFNYLIVVVLFWCIGMVLTLSAFFVFKSDNKFFLMTGSIASMSGYYFIILSNNNVSLLYILFSLFPIAIILSIVILHISRYTSQFQFILVTLALIEMVKRFEFHFDRITGGSYGVRLSTLSFDSIYLKIFLILFVFALVYFINRINYTRIGYLWEITGLTPLGAQSIGININKIFLISALASGFFSCLGGLIYIISYGYLHPNDLSNDLGLMALSAAIILRGRNFLVKFTLSTFVLFAFREILRFADIGNTVRFAVYDLILGIFLVFISIKFNNTLIEKRNN
ncbi:MAG: hypothetical protein EHM58_01340 [Ignavibacteriae bacterium]|nr:MAG: hypothetical protein EHM58_01340 [Ignavibacteriota bacterium]